MNRRAFLLSTAGLAAAPGGPLPVGTDQSPPASPDHPAELAAWLASFRPKAIAAGIRPDTVDGAFAGMVPDPVVTRRDSNQPEFSKPIGDYISAVASPGAISLGASRMSALSDILPRVSAQTGVPAEIIVAIWGIESGYGRETGSMDVIRSLTTMALAGRRLVLAEQELISALRILDQGLATRAQLKGSWAGAMGQTQFLPSDYLAYAVDGDGDGRRDIWGSSADALASTARFLQAKAHWRPQESWALEAVLPEGFDYALADADARPPLDWLAMGVSLAPGIEFSARDADEEAVLLLPAGWRGPAFMALPNHMAIRAYNNSTAYALAVGRLADGIAGRGSLHAIWPKDPPLALSERIAAQQALKTLGFDPGSTDGVLGVRTRKAAKAWQGSRGMPADGYLNLDLIRDLKAEAGLSAGAPPAAAPPAISASAD
jgi:lytic murein transglycosylase